MKKLLLIIALVTVLVVSGGLFASTYTTATATIGVTAPTSDFATVTANLTAAIPTVFGKYSGTWSSGTLFDITPDPSYTGDLVIRAYLVNTGELSRYYEHLNMTLEFQDITSTISDEQGAAQVLNLQNSEVLFTWANGTNTSPYRVELTGGGYRLHPWKSLAGGSVQPQLWLEITQR
ncbi:hypothetical protein ACFLXU_02795 [Chloroflexota bacterium]